MTNARGQDVFHSLPADVLKFDEMDIRSDMSSTDYPGLRLSSSLPPQFWGGRSQSVPTFLYHPGESNHIEASFAHYTTALHHLNVSSRSNVRRQRPSKSIGTRSALASQPVISRAPSAHEPSQPGPKTHASPSPVPNVAMSRQPGLPPVSEYSIEGILHAIEPDIQDTLDAIAEIMGRSRLSLANEYGSHMPPQGEIRAPNRLTLEHLLPVEEASSSNERLAADNVVIVGEDASMIDGSTAGSAAYGLLERLRAAPPHRALRLPTSSASRDSSDRVPPNPPGRAFSSPVPISTAPLESLDSPHRFPRSTPSGWALLKKDTSNPTRDSSQHIATLPLVSEMYLDAGANGSSASNPPIVSESGHNYPLYSYDESDLFEDPSADVTPSRLRSFQSHMQNLTLVRDFSSLAAWLHRDDTSPQRSAEYRLRAILEQATGDRETGT